MSAPVFSMEKIVERETEPYIVVKLEFIDKNVVFE